MEELSIRERAAALRAMAENGVDVLVVGGGITGAGVALDSAARGYCTGLVEKADFSSGTSSKSTKLVHGGIRYLTNFDFALTRESLVERGLLVRNAPFLARPVSFVLPLYKGLKKPMGAPIVPPFGIGMGYILRMGLIVYDLLAGRLSIHRHRKISKRMAARMVPCMRTEGLKSVFMYYDAQTDDSRLTATVMRTAAMHGAMVANYAELEGFEMDGGRIVAARVVDRVTGETLTIPARVVVNAAGAFAGRVEEMAGSSKIEIVPAKGAHLTVPREALKIGKHAVVLPETEDGRLLFLVPWGSRVTIGTTDTVGGDLDRPEASEEDIDYLLRHVNRYMKCELKQSDIISAWAGYRPLVSSRDAAVPSAKLSRTHAVMDGPGGMVTIVGGKLTTYRRMAQDTMNHVSLRLHGERLEITKNLPLAGTHEWREALAELRAAAPKLGLCPETMRRLALYGANCRTILALVREEPTLASRLVPDLPYVMAEVVYACRYEMAVTVEDVLARRLRVTLEDWNHGRAVADRVAECMARELGWDPEETARQTEAFRHSKV